MTGAEKQIAKDLKKMIAVSMMYKDSLKKTKMIEELYNKYSLLCYSNNIPQCNKISTKLGIDKLLGRSYIVDSKPYIFQVDDEKFKLATEHLTEALSNNGGISLEEAHTILDWVVQKGRIELGDNKPGNYKRKNLSGACGFGQMISLAPLQKLGLKITINNASNFEEDVERHAFGTVTIPIETDGKVEEKKFLVDLTLRQFYSTIRCNEGRYYESDDRFKEEVGPDSGYYMVNYLNGTKTATELIKRGFIEMNPEVLKQYAGSFIGAKMNINNKDNIESIKNLDANKLEKIIEEQQENFDYNDEEIETYLNKIQLIQNTRRLG